MTKSQLIDVITSVNRTTTRDFLAEFSMRDLSDYMRRLESLGLLPPEYDARRAPASGPDEPRQAVAEA